MSWAIDYIVRKGKFKALGEIMVQILNVIVTFLRGKFNKTFTSAIYKTFDYINNTLVS